MSSPAFERPGININETLSPIPGNPGVPGTATATFAATYNMGPTVPTFVSSWSAYTQLFGTFTQSNGNLLHYAVYQFFNNGGNGCYVLRIPNSDAVSATLNLQDINSPPDNVLTVTANSVGAWGNNIYVSVTSAGNAGRFNIVVYSGGTASGNIVETFVDMSINPSDQRNVTNLVNSPISGSKYIMVTSTLPGAYVFGTNDPALINATALTGGSDGVTPPNLGTAIPNSLDMLQGTILNLNIPGYTSISTLNTIISWAAGRGDVMLVIDGPTPAPPESSSQVANNYVNLVTGGSPILNSTYATLYAPWLQIADPASSAAGATVWVPPGGAVLGAWNSTDNSVGPWQAPAGVEHGVINAINLEALFTTNDLNTLNINNINAIRIMPSFGTVVMGVRTLQQGYPSKFIPVRRMLIQLEHDFTTLLQYALFAPNNQTLWDQITNTLTEYLTGLMQQGVLGGTTANTAFQIVCDSSNNSPASASAGIVNVTVAVALTSPAEFITINITQLQNTGTTTITTTA